MAGHAEQSSHMFCYRSANSNIFSMATNEPSKSSSMTPNVVDPETAGPAGNQVDMLVYQTNRTDVTVKNTSSGSRRVVAVPVGTL